MKSGKCAGSFLNNAGDVLGGTNPIPSYLQLCQKNLEFLKNPVVEKRPSSLLLSGLVFMRWVLRMYSDSSCAKESKTESSTTSYGGKMDA